MAPRPRPAAERFWEKVEITEGCWLWIAGCTTHGYGAFYDGRRQTPAHRFAYEQLVGPIPEGLHLDHLCRNRVCVNPAHLEPVTNVENVMRGESDAARNARKLECKRGHAFDEANTYHDATGRRHCRACARARWHKYRARSLATEQGALA